MRKEKKEIIEKHKELPARPALNALGVFCVIRSEAVFHLFQEIDPRGRSFKPRVGGDAEVAGRGFFHGCLPHLRHGLNR